MATTTGTAIAYNSYTKDLHEGVDISSDALKVKLLTSSYTPNAESHTDVSDLTNEVSGNGYAEATLANVTNTRSTTVTTLNADDVIFTASGGSITAYYYVIYNSTTSDLICYGLLDTTPLDVVTTDGNTLTIQWNASGILTVTKT